MTNLKITKKHHKHLNNPFTSQPKSLPFIQGSLFNSQTVSSHKVFPIGNDFQLLWSSKNGGQLSVSHHSQPARSLWSTIPGRAFVSAALAETEVKESRGSFVIKDNNVHLICDHQSIEDIRVINQHRDLISTKKYDSLSEFDQKFDLKNTQFPVLVVTGSLFSKNRNKRDRDSGINKVIDFEKKKISMFASARYWVLFYQINSSQIGFQVKVGQPNYVFQPQTSLTPVEKCRRLRRKLGRIRKLKFGWCWDLSRPRGFAAISSSKYVAEVNVAESTEFNRICMTYSSEENEMFYGFGEQFSHMNFKGKRVPIFVQEQGIGRGDQPITFAANLVSYRAGGDWSTTYAPSPFYMTSKMRSLYLLGYDYSVFDLTGNDRVQILIHSSTVEGRILHGNSPTELIECFTETIGRPPELPKWIISGAVVGMQGGTQAVRRVWDELTIYKVPISAFWLQVFQFFFQVPSK